MTVLMTMKLAGDGAALEKAAQSDPAMIRGIVENAKSHGLIAHHFWASDNTVLVVDEWPDEQSFHAFFDATPEVPKLMAASGITSQPEISFWRKLETGDDFRA
ncbi:MAG: hypothetical protein JWO57_4461 [Pseudonocardiales bacterium]|nr:hypothetical protein [Pseudonocardiales bacterium]